MESFTASRAETPGGQLIGILSEMYIQKRKSIMKLSKFVWTLRSSVLVVFKNFFHIDATDRSKISSDLHR